MVKSWQITDQGKHKLVWTPFDQNGGDLTHALDRIFASRQYIERNPLADFLGRLSSEEESITLSLERYVRKVVRRNSLFN